jgi:hypothetical protein
MCQIVSDQDTPTRSSSGRRSEHTPDLLASGEKSAPLDTSATMDLCLLVPRHVPAIQSGDGRAALEGTDCRGLASRACVERGDGVRAWLF